MPYRVAGFGFLARAVFGIFNTPINLYDISEISRSVEFEAHDVAATVQ
jgi:hypothetical protein